MKYLIKDTTRIERIRLIKQWEEDLSYEDSGFDLLEFYDDYIEGKKEISEVNMSYKTNYVVAYPEEMDQKGPSCGMGNRR